MSAPFTEPTNTDSFDGVGADDKGGRRMTEHSRKWSSTGHGLDAAESEARRLEKKGTFAATMDDDAGTVTLSKDDFKAVMGKLGGHKQVAKRSQTNLILLAFGYLAVSVGFIAVIVGLMNWRIEATKETVLKGSDLVGKNGKVAHVDSVESFAQIYDIPKFKIDTINRIKQLTVTLGNGQEKSFRISMVEKKEGERHVKFTDALKNVIVIDGNNKQTIVTLADGTKHIAAGAATSTERRLATLTNDSPRLFTAADFWAHRERVRNLEVSGSAEMGYASLAIAATEGAVDDEANRIGISWKTARVNILITSFLGTDIVENTTKATVWLDGEKKLIKKHFDNGFATIAAPDMGYYAKQVAEDAWHCGNMSKSDFSDFEDGQLSNEAVDNGAYTTVSKETTDGKRVVVEILNISFDVVATSEEVGLPSDVQCWNGNTLAEKEFANLPEEEVERRMANYEMVHHDEKHAEKHRELVGGGYSCAAAHLSSRVYEWHGTRGYHPYQHFYIRRNTGLIKAMMALNPIIRFFKMIGHTHHHDIKATLYRNGGTYALAFKGSDDLEDFDHDTAMGQLNGRLAGIMEDYNELTTLGHFNNMRCPNFVTGHSLGGFLATIYKEKHRCRGSTQLYTFGALATDASNKVYVDGKRFANYMDPAIGNLYISILRHPTNYRLSHVQHKVKETYGMYTKKVCAATYCAWWGYRCGGCGWRGCNCGWWCAWRRCSWYRWHSYWWYYGNRHQNFKGWNRAGACGKGWWGIFKAFCYKNWDYHNMQGYISFACNTRERVARRLESAHPTKAIF